MTLDNATLIQSVQQQLAAIFPTWGPCRDAWIVRERRATFAATPHAESLRPTAETPLNGLWLAGDHLATGLPATLESAVRSGFDCAQRILSAEAGRSN